MVGIISNNAALFAQRNLAVASSTSESSIARLSSGNAIVSAADDVAGLAIGTVLRTTVSTLKTIISSVSQATSLLGIADAGLQNIGEILQRQKALAVQANTGSLSNNERAFLDQEFQSLVSEIDRIVTNTKFNGIALLDGALGSTGSQPQADVSTVAFTDTGLGTDAFVGDVSNNRTVATFVIEDAEGNEHIAGLLNDISVQAAGVDGDDLTLFVTVGGVVYTGTGLDFEGGAGPYTLTNAAGSDITFSLSGGLDAGDIDGDAADAAAFAAFLESQFQTVTVTQTRNFIATDTSGGIHTNDTAGTVLEGVDGADIALSSDAATNFDNVSFGNFTVIHEETGAGIDGLIGVTINGIYYRTEAGAFDGIANDITAAPILLYRNGDSTAYANEYLSLDLAAAANFGIETDAEAQGLEDALNTVFGNGGSLTFQVGTTASDSIGLSLGGAGTTAIYLDDTGASQTLDVASSASAQTASDVLDNAINTVTSLRATIGALQSRFNFAASSVNASIQNTEAARAIFLDVDIAEESTKFATAQVRLQASISVLAQANLIPQNLLKLIG